MSEGSDSTNYLTTVSVERYNNRPGSSVHRSTTFEGNNHHRTSRYTPLAAQEESNRNNYSSPMTKSTDAQANYRSSKSKRSVEWDEGNLHQNEGKFGTSGIHFRVTEACSGQNKKRNSKLLSLPVDSLKYALVPYTGNAKRKHP